MSLWRLKRCECWQQHRKHNAARQVRAALRRRRPSQKAADERWAAHAHAEKIRVRRLVNRDGGRTPSGPALLPERRPSELEQSFCQVADFASRAGKSSEKRAKQFSQVLRFAGLECSCRARQGAHSSFDHAHPGRGRGAGLAGSSFMWLERPSPRRGNIGSAALRLSEYTCINNTLLFTYLSLRTLNQTRSGSLEPEIP